MVSLAEAASEIKDILKKELSYFSCQRNQDIEDYLKDPEKAIRLEDKNISRTYLLFDNHNFKIAAYFSICLKVFETSGISKSEVKRIHGLKRNAQTIPIYLIGQLGKNDLFKDKIKGSELLDFAENRILKAKQIVGGRNILVECKDEPKLKQFYITHGYKELQVSPDNGLVQFIKYINN